MIIVGGIDKTDSIASCEMRGETCRITFVNSPKTYNYGSKNVKILRLIRETETADLILKVNGKAVSDARKFQDFGEFYRIIFLDGKRRTYRHSEIEISKNCLAGQSSRELFEYFRETASAISLRADNGINILSLQYDKIRGVSSETVLAKYLSHEQPAVAKEAPDGLIYPFGLNQSQKKAVENAFRSPISIIQGPPGTGKTQTILNILANAVLRGRTVAVVSNNNSATRNVAEKLEKNGLSFLTAFLGSLENKEAFLKGQTGTYPNMGGWALSREEYGSLVRSAKELSEELNKALASRNRIAEIEQELLDLRPEQYYFQDYYAGKKKLPERKLAKRLTSKKALSLWLEYESRAEQGRELNLFEKILLLFRFRADGMKIFREAPEGAIPYLQNLFYQAKIAELEEEKNRLERKLKDYRFEEKMRRLSQESMRLFKAKLARTYSWKTGRKCFEKPDFRKDSQNFNKEYPIILSTTYSIKGTLSTEHVYDYLIIDEASQVDLATGVLAFSCARNVIIVGDQKQLPNVLSPKDVQMADDVWYRHGFDERYHFATHSLLASAAEIWEEAPSVLLREHYRCHPKIAGFFNQKFYNGELIVMTEDHGENDVLSMIRTADGNHARGHMNQRQIDVIAREVLPSLEKRGYKDIGIITPYRDQVAAISAQLGEKYEVATVHKFQGREKDAIVLASVDNEIGEFVDDPNMLNVAVSRAVKSLTVVISNNRENEKTNYGDLGKYIRYHNFQIADSHVYSVFDLLYKSFYAQRMDYLKKHGRVSEYDSENLAFSVIQEVLSAPEFSKIGCSMHMSLATLIRDDSILTEEERKYGSNPLTHVDFLLFNRMDKAPVLAIEIDGTAFHREGSRQAERDNLKNSIFDKCGIHYLRIRTNESGEKEKIQLALRYAM